MPVFRVNGIMPDFAKLSLMIGPLGYTPLITEISYKSPRKRKHYFGAARNPVGRGGGKVEPEASFTMYREALDDLLNRLGPSFGDVEFPIMVSYRKAGSILYTTDTLEDACIVNPDFSPTEGDDALMVKVELSIMKVLWNGKAIAEDDFTLGF